MHHLFFELLQISLGNRKRFSRIPTPAEWEQLLLLSKKQAIDGVMTDGLERLPKEQLPKQELLLQWIGLSQLLAATYSLHYQRAQELTSQMRAAGFHGCVLKGIGIAQLYPNPERRQCGDIDVWVEGKRTDVLAWLKTRCETEHMIWLHVDANLFDDVPVEVHFHPSWMYNPFNNRRIQKWFDSQRDEQMATNEQLGFIYPTVQFNVIYSLAHLCHHLIEEGVGFRHVIDYYYVVKALPATSKIEVISLLKLFGLYDLACAIMWVLKDVCGMSEEYLICEPNEKEGRFLLDEIMRGGNFGHYRNDNRQRNTTGRMAALLAHYPSEVLWVVPWKMWHRCWMFYHKND